MPHNRFNNTYFKALIVSRIERKTRTTNRALQKEDYWQPLGCRFLFASPVERGTLTRRALRRLHWLFASSQNLELALKLLQLSREESHVSHAKLQPHRNKILFKKKTSDFFRNFRTNRKLRIKGWKYDMSFIKSRFNKAKREFSRRRINCELSEGARPKIPDKLLFGILCRA